MKINFPLPTDKEKSHRYCMVCHADAIEMTHVDGLTKWKCGSCGKISDRYIHIGNTPKDGRWWVADDGEMWHESAGVFVRNPEGKYLFFDRVAFPFGYTVPAGHVDNGDASPQAAAVKELEEEVGLVSHNMTHALDVDIVESCGGGGDSHRWHIFREDLDEAIDAKVTEEDEGKDPVWMTLEEARTKELPPAIRYLLDNHAEQI
jgi:8-oxo-dGTP pyrophosphatase MutT (NUDIX family)